MLKKIVSKFKAKAPMQDRGMAKSAPGRAKAKPGGVVGKPMKPKRGVGLY